ncbi:unnamed protein product, partial [Polarella glacialis]
GRVHLQVPAEQHLRDAPQHLFQSTSFRFVGRRSRVNMIHQAEGHLDVASYAEAVAAALAELQCHICLETVVLPEAAPCGHLFCGPCLRTWLCRSSSCPACKAPVPLGNGCGLRLVGIGPAARALEEARAPGAYGAREREALAKLASLETGTWVPTGGSSSSSPAALSPSSRRQRLLKATPIVTPLRMRQFHVATDVHSRARCDWETKAVDFQLERISRGGAANSWEPAEWCWVSRLELPFPQLSSSHPGAQGSHRSVSAWALELRIVVGSHNRVLDPCDEDERLCLRLEALEADSNVNVPPSAGCSWWLLLQIALVLGDEVAALPFVVVLGDPFVCPQAIQPAQSPGLARAAVTSQDSGWRHTRHLVHCLARDHLVDTSASLPPAGFDVAAALLADSGRGAGTGLASAKLRRLEAVVSAQSVEFDSAELAERHADLFGRDESGQVDGFQMTR